MSDKFKKGLVIGLVGFLVYVSGGLIPAGTLFSGVCQFIGICVEQPAK